MTPLRYAKMYAKRHTHTQTSFNIHYGMPTCMPKCMPKCTLPNLEQTLRITRLKVFREFFMVASNEDDKIGERR